MGRNRNVRDWITEVLHTHHPWLHREEVPHLSLSSVKTKMGGNDHGVFYYNSTMQQMLGMGNTSSFECGRINGVSA